MAGSDPARLLAGLGVGRGIGLPFGRVSTKLEIDKFERDYDVVLPAACRAFLQTDAGCTARLTGDRRPVVGSVDPVHGFFALQSDNGDGGLVGSKSDVLRVDFWASLVGLVWLEMHDLFRHTGGKSNGNLSKPFDGREGIRAVVHAAGGG